MRLTSPRPHPEREDYFLACASFSSEDPVDGFWTYSKCFTGSWLGSTDGSAGSALAACRSKFTRARKRCAGC